MTPIEAISRLGGVTTSQLEPIPASGAYALILRVTKRIDCKPEKPWVLKPGTYIYAGRATRGLPARLARHKKRTKPVHWHIDHLTVRQTVAIENILVIPAKPNLECVIVQTLLEQNGVTVPVHRFGSSDCREGCPAHLLQITDDRSTPLTV